MRKRNVGQEIIQGLGEAIAHARGIKQLRMTKLKNGSPCASRLGMIPRLESLTRKGVGLQTYLDQVEGELIMQALVQTHWNQCKAARLLGIHRTTLWNRICSKHPEIRKQQIHRESPKKNS